MPRTTLDLIDELRQADAEEEGAAVTLVIGFEATTEFVFASEAPAAALAKLNAAIERGGEPVGLIGLRQSVPGKAGILVRPLEEYAEEEWVEKYLFSLVGEVRRRLARPDDAGDE